MTNKGLKEDFALALEGRRIGDLLNTLPDQPAPDVGVLPAGGIAVSYHGRVVDLLGLNWVEMAHASGRRTGVPGHSAFIDKHCDDSRLVPMAWERFRPPAPTVSVATN